MVNALLIVAACAGWCAITSAVMGSKLGEGALVGALLATPLVIGFYMITGGF